MKCFYGQFYPVRQILDNIERIDYSKLKNKNVLIYLIIMQQTKQNKTKQKFTRKFSTLNFEKQLFSTFKRTYDKK